MTAAGGCGAERDKVSKYHLLRREPGAGDHAQFRTWCLAVHDLRVLRKVRLRDGHVSGYPERRRLTIGPIQLYHVAHLYLAQTPEEPVVALLLVVSKNDAGARRPRDRGEAIPTKLSDCGQGRGHESVVGVQSH